MASYDGYETSFALPPERREWEKVDLGKSERPTGVYDQEKGQYAFSDGITVTDEELMAADRPLIRLYYEKKAEAARRAAGRKLQSVEDDIVAWRADPDQFPPEYRADLQRRFSDAEELRRLEKERVALATAAMERKWATERRAVERARKVAEAKNGWWALARFGHAVARARGAEGLRALGTFGEVLRLAADFNYGGATRGWMLEMD